MTHSHPVYDSDPHFKIDPISRAITNDESKKIILMQNDHNSERFSFEIPKLVEGHDVTLCNQVEIHFTNSDSTKQGTNAGVYEVEDMIVDPEDENRVIFTWLVSENATKYAGSLSFIVMFSCVENGVSVYRWNTAINNSISIARSMNNGEIITDLFPDILAQWKNELFAAATGNQLISVGPIEPEAYPYIWLDTSEFVGTSEKNVGYLTIKTGDGISQRLYPIVQIGSIVGLQDALDVLSDQQQANTDAIDDLKTAVDDISAVNPYSLRFTGAANATYDGSEEVVIDIPTPPTVEDIFSNPINRDVTFNGTITANKIVGAVYM